MIEYKSGNLLTEAVGALVSPVDCVGAMRRGLALQFGNAFPENFQVYAAACKREEVQPGRVFIFAPQGSTGADPVARNRKVLRMTARCVAARTDRCQSSLREGSPSEPEGQDDPGGRGHAQIACR